MLSVEQAPKFALGAVADSALGKMLDSKKQRGEPHPYLRNINVRWREFDLGGLQSTPLTEAEVQRFEVRPGDVMVCEGGEPGRCAVWRNGPEEVAYQKALHRIKVRDRANLESDFVALVLEQAIRSGRCDHLFTGTTIKHLPQEKLRTIPIPVPTISEQVEVHRKATEVWEAQFRIGLEIEKTQHHADCLRRALLTAAFSGRLTRDRRHLDTEELVSL